MPAHLADRCRRSISQKRWRDGGDYVAKGRVTIDDSDAAGLMASVKGSDFRPYRVGLDWSLADEDGLLFAGCTCPHFDEGHLCKHIAAVILAADLDSFSSRVPGRGDLDVIDDREEWEGDVDSDDDGWDDVGPGRRGSGMVGGARQSSSSAARAPRSVGPQPAPPAWQKQLQLLTRSVDPSSPARVVAPPAKVRHICYRLNREEIARRGRLVVDFYQRELKQNGEFGRLKLFKLAAHQLLTLEDPLDRELLSWMVGNHAEDQYSNGYYSYGYASHTQFCRCELAPAMYLKLAPRLCETGRFDWAPERHSPESEELAPLAWDDGPPWRFKLQFDRAPKGGPWRLTGLLQRGDETSPLDAIRFAGAGLVLFERVAARLNESAATGWIEAMRRAGVLEVPGKQRDAFLQQLFEAPDLPPIDLPDELRWTEITAAPVPRLTITPSRSGDKSPLDGAVSFDYGGETVAWRDRRTAFAKPERRELVRRDFAREQAAWAPLQNLHLRAPREYERDRYDVSISHKQLPLVVAELIAAGWQVEAEGCKLRRPGQFKISVSSGVDWFELDALADYDGIPVALPQLLKALKRGESFVELGDGSRGMLPEEWLARYAPLAEMGEIEDGKLRFVHSQAMLLDAWLAAQGEVDVDATFERVRNRLRSFEGVKPVREPAGFQGELRPYQREGLGWLDFLDEFAFGGCLADDMGLGKTIQVLALLESRRGSKSKSSPRAPSLVVAPRSLIHNWIAEAGRFTPQLRVLDYTGQQRSEQREQFDRYDLVITTYGTLRRDVGQLKDFDFEYCVLDEAQSIKNADSHSAKACRLLRARRRLAMTGTPVENHLGELWSIFEFLNPGMLGRSAALKRLSCSAPGKDPGAIEALAKGLRPFLLRRTKEQVLSELPEKMEQTLYCELEKKQRKLYDELRNHYRDLLAHRIESVGLKKSKIQVLEALLRLRQAACHPGLIDPKQSGQPSAKLEALLEQLQAVLAEGHKALVFSQFTSLLAIVRKELDRRAIAYEYLDGKTRNRKERVDRFQENPACPLFLISLKAGGLGLNLTAADYVFILDPWWNPAVEAQAVDRAHRIGQTRRVFAYRLIARDTVEEKILELQHGKRKLAEAIVSADNSLIRSLTADDLHWLLS